jgi:hypothetical protein
MADGSVLRYTFVQSPTKQTRLMSCRPLYWQYAGSCHRLCDLHVWVARFTCKILHLKPDKNFHVGSLVPVVVSSLGSVRFTPARSLWFSIFKPGVLLRSTMWYLTTISPPLLPTIGRTNHLVIRMIFVWITQHISILNTAVLTRLSIWKTIG